MARLLSAPRGSLVRINWGSKGVDLLLLQGELGVNKEAAGLVAMSAENATGEEGVTQREETFHIYILSFSYGLLLVRNLSWFSS